MELENKRQEEITNKKIDDDRVEQLLDWAANAIVKITLHQHNEVEKKRKNELVEKSPNLLK